MSLHSSPQRMLVSCTRQPLPSWSLASAFTALPSALQHHILTARDNAMCVLQAILEQAGNIEEASLQLLLPHLQPTPGPHHQRMLAAARLSKQQQRVLCALRCAVFTNFGRLQGRRARCIARLQVNRALIGLRRRSAVCSDVCNACQRRHVCFAVWQPGREP